jgi:hypothetical protein
LIPTPTKLLLKPTSRPSWDWVELSSGPWGKARNSKRMQVLQVNLHHSRAASAVLCVAMKNCDVALIQEPWTHKGAIRGLKEVGGELIYSRSAQNPRNCILIKKDFQILPLMHHCSRDFTATMIKTSGGNGPREIILGSAYLPYDDGEPPPPGELERLVMSCRMQGTHLIIGCDANSHHTSWGSTNINNRGESLFNYIMANGLDIMNRGKRFTFVTSNRQEVIDITIATLYAGNLVKDLHVSEEISCSDHRHIRFTVTGIDHTVVTYRNPRRTDWESFRTDLLGCLSGMTDKINNCIDLEIAANQLQDAFVYAYNENFPLIMKGNTRNTPWWNQDLAVKRREVRRLFNVAKKSGNWTDYKRTLTEYNKHSGRPRENRGGDTARRLKRLLNVLYSTGFSQRMSRVLLAPFNLKMENIPIQRKGHWRNYSGSTSLVQK